MKKKLQRIKDESQQICSEVSSALHSQATELSTIADATPPFKTLEEFDVWFNSNAPLVL